MNRHTLTAYVVGTILVWGAILIAVWFLAPSHTRDMMHLCGMFYIGMLAMYIAQHVYPFHPWH
jgi:drug/metabolite transporter (DMT)-like permease